MGSGVGPAGDQPLQAGDSPIELVDLVERPPESGHPPRPGLAPSARGPREPGLDEYARSTLEARSVTGVFAQDLWHPLSDLEVEHPRLLRDVRLKRDRGRPDLSGRRQLVHLSHGLVYVPVFGVRVHHDRLGDHGSGQRPMGWVPAVYFSGVQNYWYGLKTCTAYEAP